MEERIQRVRKHFEQKGYRVHSGLQFGCELVLYADDPSRVHSDYCISIVPKDGRLDWQNLQVLVRSMSDYHKTLILVNVSEQENGDDAVVEEIALTTEHAPFRHKARIIQSAGGQTKATKKQKDG